jgi:primosomal protein N'
VLPHALSGNIDDFYQDEIKLRETFSYPPFSALIKMSVTGEKKAVEHEIALIAERFEAYDLHVYPASIRAGSNRETRHALLRLQRGAWPEAKLVESLRGLPPYVVVDVDPENLL